MFKFLSNCFKKTIYKESAFFIKKSMDNIYFLKAQNGLHANIHFHDDKMYVSIFSTNKHNKYSEELSYFVNKKDSSLSIIDFIVKNIKNNIMFYLKTDDIDRFLTSNSSIKYTSVLLKFMGYNFDSNKQDLFIGSVSYFNEKMYQELIFVKKKIIKNVYKFKFYKVITPTNKQKININYIINHDLFELSNMGDFKTSVSDSKVIGKWIGFKFSSNMKECYGVDGVLNEQMHNLIKSCNLKKIRILKKGNDCCFFEKNKGQVTLRYLSNYDAYTSELNHKDNKHFYLNSLLVLMTYAGNKITVTKSKFGFQTAMEHQSDILSMVTDKLANFSRRHPSEHILTTLSELGMPCELPLSSEAIKVVEMFNV